MFTIYDEIKQSCTFGPWEKLNKCIIEFQPNTTHISYYGKLDKTCGKIDQDRELLQRECPLVECSEATTSQIHLFCTQLFNIKRDEYFLHPKKRLKAKQTRVQESQITSSNNEVVASKPPTPMPTIKQDVNTLPHENVLTRAKQIQEDKENLKKNVNYILNKGEIRRAKSLKDSTNPVQEYSSILKKFQFTSPGQMLEQDAAKSSATNQNKNVILKLTNKSNTSICEDLNEFHQQYKQQQEQQQQQSQVTFNFERDQSVKSNRPRLLSSARLTSSKSDSTSSTNSQKSNTRQTLTEILAIKNSLTQNSKQTSEAKPKITRSKSSVATSSQVKYVFYSSNSKIYDKNSYYVYYPTHEIDPQAKATPILKPSLAQLQSTLSRSNTMYNMPMLNNGYRTLIGESRDILDTMQINGKQILTQTNNRCSSSSISRLSHFKTLAQPLQSLKMITTNVNK